MWRGQFRSFCPACNCKFIVTVPSTVRHWRDVALVLVHDRRQNFHNVHLLMLHANIYSYVPMRLSCGHVLLVRGF